MLRPLIALTALLLAPAAVAAPPAEPARIVIEGMPGWMAGTWMMEHGSDWAEEVWTAPRGGMMLGMGRSGFGPDVQVWESLRIEKGPDGRLGYVAQVKGGTLVRFPMATFSDAAIEFANPAHDYPQRIRYWREGQLLMAETAMLDGSRAERWNFRPVATAAPELERQSP